MPDNRSQKRTVLRMALTRCAKRSVLCVSARFGDAGLMLAIIIVFELPPSESCTQRAMVTSMAAGARQTVRHVRQKF